MTICIFYPSREKIKALLILPKLQGIGRRIKRTNPDHSRRKLWPPFVNSSRPFLRDRNGGGSGRMMQNSFHLLNLSYSRHMENARGRRRLPPSLSICVFWVRAGTGRGDSDAIGESTGRDLRFHLRNQKGFRKGRRKACGPARYHGKTSASWFR
ncbi:MAG: hypothetical protein H6Q43_491 [Deltaproteobacteria bacterium]|nr:hypothetical protein [Deltaproteobacteria bacterium]